MRENVPRLPFLKVSIGLFVCWPETRLSFCQTEVSGNMYPEQQQQQHLSFDAFLSSFPLAESQQRDLQITAYK